jgi:hypothetical protein
MGKRLLNLMSQLGKARATKPAFDADHGILVVGL